jgi:CHAD domain-containing protein
MLGLVAWIETGAWRESEAAQTGLAAFGRMRLDKRWRKVKRGGSDLRHLDPEPLHRLRIEVKKLRYAVEFLASLEHRDEAIVRRTAASAALEDLQEHLGELNDLETARALLASLVPAEAMKSADHWLQPNAPQGDPIDAAEGAYGRLVEAGPFWR